jgi:hypothetical protein
LAIFHNTELRDRTDNNPAFYVKSFVVLQLSDAKTDFYNPFYLLNYQFEKYFSKIWLMHLNYFQGFRPSFLMSGRFTAKPSICFRGPWVRLVCYSA